MKQNWDNLQNDYNELDDFGLTEVILNAFEKSERSIPPPSYEKTHHHCEVWGPPFEKFKHINPVPMILIGWLSWPEDPKQSKLSFIVLIYCTVDKQGNSEKISDRGWRWIYRGVLSWKKTVLWAIQKYNLDTEKKNKKMERLQHKIKEGKFKTQKAKGWYKKICENCGREFLTKRSDSRACPMSACKKNLTRKKRTNRPYIKKVLS